jgi:hypothetical protein
VFRVAPILGDTEPADEPASADPPKPPAQTAVKPATPFSFNTTLDQLRVGEPATNGQAHPEPGPPAKVTVGGASETAPPSPPADQPVTANLPAPDFFRSGGQSFASAAAMVNDILAATPDSGSEPGQAGADEPAKESAEEPAAPAVPITPDFFTAPPKKRFRLRR